MTCTVTHTITASGGRTVARGTRPAKPVRLEVSVWLVYPSGLKNTHTVVVAAATLAELAPAVDSRIEELIAETHTEVVSGGWTAHGRGVKPKKRR